MTSLTDIGIMDAVKNGIKRGMLLAASFLLGFGAVCSLFLL